MKTDCFREGVDARAAGAALSDNPYGIRTEEHADWAAGWRATFDLDEDADPASTRNDAVDGTDAGRRRGPRRPA